MRNPHYKIPARSQPSPSQVPASWKPKTFGFFCFFLDSAAKFWIQPSNLGFSHQFLDFFFWNPDFYFFGWIFVFSFSVFLFQPMLSQAIFNLNIKILYKYEMLRLFNPKCNRYAGVVYKLASSQLGKVIAPACEIHILRFQPSPSQVPASWQPKTFGFFWFFVGLSQRILHSAIIFWIQPSFFAFFWNPDFLLLSRTFLFQLMPSQAFLKSSIKIN